MKADREVVKAALNCSKLTCCPLRYAHQSLRDDRDLTEMAIKSFGAGGLTSASPRLMKDHDLVRKALMSGAGITFKEFPDEIRSDRDWCLLAVKHASYAFESVDHALKHDKEFCIEAFKANPDCLHYIPSRIKALKSFKKALGPDLGPSPDQIRKAFLEALEGCIELGPLSGKGHVARVTLNKKFASALRGIDLPRIHISGYGANWHYPESLVASAADVLGFNMSDLTVPS